MNNLNLVIIFLIFILNSCTLTIQNNGLSEKKIENFNIKIGETSRKNIISNYGPPIFEDVFNDNVIYYISHNTSYKTFDERKTEKLLVLEIKFDNKNIVQEIKKYSDKNSIKIKVSENQDSSDMNFTQFWKDLLSAFRRKNTEN